MFILKNFLFPFLFVFAYPGCVKKQTSNPNSDGAGRSTAQDVSCERNGASNEVFALVSKLAQNYDEKTKIPGLPGGIEDVPEAKTGRYLVTNSPELLKLLKSKGAAFGVRKSVPIEKLSLEPVAKRIKEMELSDIIVVSRHSGSAGYVRVGCLPDGQIVVAKAYPPRPHHNVCPPFDL